MDRSMNIQLASIAIPEFGLPESRPRIPAETYSRRCDEVVRRAQCDWVVVYADREHQANIAFLTGFEPRFEEALLLLGRKGERIVLAGNECRDYTPIAGLPNIRTVLAQSLSLMGQDRTKSPNLAAVMRECGLANGQTIGLVGWKYLEDAEVEDEDPGFFVPHHIVRVLERIAADATALKDVTSVLMHQTTGLRAVVDADEIAMLEWGASRASAAVWRVLSNASPGDTELGAAARMAYAGEPMSCHFMLSSSGSDPIIGLSSPTGRRIALGDGVTACAGFWGGLSSRGGLLAEHDEPFLSTAKGYFETLLTWYETADIGVAGASMYAAVEARLDSHGLRPALNPGHLLSHDEWMNTPVRKSGQDTLASGMPFQVDIIPVPMRDGETLNCEDAVVFADADLRAEIERKHPQVHTRMMARRRFMADKIGIELKPSVLPLSSTPLCLAPFWLRSDQLLTRA